MMRTTEYEVNYNDYCEKVWSFPDGIQVRECGRSFEVYAWLPQRQAYRFLGFVWSTSDSFSSYCHRLDAGENPVSGHWSDGIGHTCTSDGWDGNEYSPQSAEWLATVFSPDGSVEEQLYHTQWADKEDEFFLHTLWEECPLTVAEATEWIKDNLTLEQQEDLTEVVGEYFDIEEMQKKIA